MLIVRDDLSQRVLQVAGWRGLVLAVCPLDVEPHPERGEGAVLGPLGFDGMPVMEKI